MSYPILYLEGVQIIIVSQADLDNLESCGVILNIVIKHFFSMWQQLLACHRCLKNAVRNLSSGTGIVG